MSAQGLTDEELEALQNSARPTPRPSDGLTNAQLVKVQRAAPKKPIVAAATAYDPNVESVTVSAQRAPRAPEPVPEWGYVKRGLYGAYDTFRKNTILGAALDYYDISQQRQQAKMLREQGQTDAAARLEAGIGRPSRMEREYMAQPGAFADDNASFGTRLARGATDLGSMFAGATLSPEGLVTDIGAISRAVAPRVGYGTGKIVQAVAPKVATQTQRTVRQAVGRVGAAAATQAVVQGATDPAVQALQIASGTREDYSPLQTVEQTLAGGLFGGAMHGAAELKAPLGNMLQDWKIKRAIEQQQPVPVQPLREDILGPGPAPQAPLPGESPPVEGAPRIDMRGRPMDPAPEAIPAVPEPVPDAIPVPETVPGTPGTPGTLAGIDPVEARYHEAVQMVRDAGNADPAYIARRLEIPPEEAAAHIGRMEQEGHVSPADPEGVRTVYPEGEGRPVAPEQQPAPQAAPPAPPAVGPVVEPLPTEAPPAPVPEAQPVPAAPAPVEQAPAPPAPAPAPPAPVTPAKPAKAAKATGSINKAQPRAADGRLPVADTGHVQSERGQPIKFKTSDQAKNWIAKNATEGQQFEIVPHEKGYSAKELPSDASGNAAPGKEVPVPPSPDAAHDKTQSDIDADVKKAQQEGKINVPEYDHSKPAEKAPAETDGSPEGKPEVPAGEGPAQSGGPSGKTVGPGDKPAGEGDAGADGGKTGGAEPAGKSGAGSKPVEPAGSKPADGPGDKKPAGEAPDEKPKSGGSEPAGKIEPDIEKKPAKNPQPFKHEHTGDAKLSDIENDFSNWETHNNYPKDAAGTAQSIQDYLLSRGEQTGHEASVTFDPTTNKITAVRTGGLAAKTPMTFPAQIYSNAGRIVSHHNHPIGGSLSDMDIKTLRYPGHHWVVAHEPGGVFYAARAAGKFLKKIQAAKTEAALTRYGNKLAKQLAGYQRVLYHDYFKARVEKGEMTKREAMHLWSHAAMAMLERSGQVEYITSKEFTPHERAIIEDAISRVSSLIGETGAKLHYRPSEPVRFAEGIDRLHSQVREGPGSGGSGPADKKLSAGQNLKEVTADLHSADPEQGGDIEARARANIDMREQFHSEPVTSDELWDNTAKTLNKDFGWGLGEAKRWVQEWKENLSGFASGKPPRPKSIGLANRLYDKIAPAISMAEQLLKDADGVLRSRAIARKSEVMRKVADLMFAATEGIKRGIEAKPEDYFSARYRWQNKWNNQYGKATAHLSKLPMAERNAALEQIGRLVQNPKNIVRGTPMGDAAHEITQIFKETHAYLREAGVDVGTVREGYLPRIEDTQKILANESDFLKRAKAAYIASGFSQKQAEGASKEWLNRVTLGDFGLNAEGMPIERGSTAIPSNFTKGRVLTKEADNIMGDFYHQNVRDIVPRYVRQAVGRAEWSRRFGRRDLDATAPAGLSTKEALDWHLDPNGKWKDMHQALIDEGNGDLSGVLARTVRGMTGNVGAPTGAYGGWENASVWLRTANILGKLSYSTLTSLAEPFTNAVQTGNAGDAIRAYGGLIKHWVPFLKKLGDGEYLRDLASDLNVIGDHWDASSALQLTGGESGNAMADKLVEKFFRLTGQAQFTEASRITSIGIGQVFLRRLAKDVESGGHFARMSHDILADFGVRDPKGFAKYVSSLDKPTAKDLEAGGQHGADYAQALQRYVQRTVMHPTAAMKPTYAKHPLGSMVFALQSFNYAFKKQVLDRVVKQTAAGLNLKNDLNPYERAMALAPMGNMALMVLTSYAIGEVRDALLPDPTKAGKDPMSGKDKMWRAASRTGLFGYADPLVNMATQTRYQVDVNTALAGPILGPVGSAMGAAIDLGRNAVAPNEDEDPDSTARSRRVAASAWDVAVRPALQSVITMGVPNSGFASRAIGTGLSYALADRRTRAKVIETTGGEQE